MASVELPSEYDAIVLGTGMTESILAAALARIGWKVLHLDRNDYYSGEWACFSFDSLQTWINETANKNALCIDENLSYNIKIQSNEKLIPLQVSLTSKQFVKEYSFIPATIEINSDTNAENTNNFNVLSDTKTSEKSIDIDNELENEIQNDGLLNECQTDEIDSEKTLNKVSDEIAINESKHINFKNWSLELLCKESRKFSIDLSPRLLYCRGEMVELLVSSDVAKYCEFRSITRVITEINNELESVPCSRSDVFNSKKISMLEKHMLMKLLTNCLEFDQDSENKVELMSTTFKEYLSLQKISDNIQHYVLNAIAMAEDSTSAYDGLILTKKFLQSLGRYGNTAFLWPIYGSGELPQCFCRLCAVFGGIYCLKRTASSLIVNSDNECNGIVDTQGQTLKAKTIIMEASYATQDICSNISENQKKISRVILFTNKSILNDIKQEDLTLFRLPDYSHLHSCAILLELSSVSMICPKDIYVVYISCLCSKNAEDDLQPIVNDYFQTKSDLNDSLNKKPKVLWCVYFEQSDTSNFEFLSNVKGTYVVGGPDFHLDYDRSIQQAQSLFKIICPDEEFLPRAPDPEDIIFDDVANHQEPENSCIKESEQNDKNSITEEITKSCETEQI